VLPRRASWRCAGGSVRAWRCSLAWKKSISCRCAVRGSPPPHRRRLRRGMLFGTGDLARQTLGERVLYSRMVVERQRADHASRQPSLSGSWPRRGWRDGGDTTGELGSSYAQSSSLRSACTARTLSTAGEARRGTTHDPRPLEVDPSAARLVDVALPPHRRVSGSASDHAHARSALGRPASGCRRCRKIASSISSRLPARLFPDRAMESEAKARSPG
jgi:hypothetical protein